MNAKERKALAEALDEKDLTDQELIDLAVDILTEDEDERDRLAELGRRVTNAFGPDPEARIHALLFRAGLIGVNPQPGDVWTVIAEGIGT